MDLPKSTRLLRWTLALTLLGLQVAAIVYARFVPTRYFCWAPFDMQTDYRLQVEVNGRRLTPAEIRRRYRRGPQGTDNRSFSHLTDILEGAERRYHPQDRTSIVMTYRINGGEERTWIYRQP